MSNILQTVNLIKLKPTDLSLFEDLIALFVRVFDSDLVNPPSKKQLEELLKTNSFHVFVALMGEKVVGGLTAYELMRYYEAQSELFIYDLAVETSFQNQGIGKRLIAEVQAFCREKGIGSGFVATHAEDVQAIAFYHATMGTPEDVKHFSLKLA